MLHRTTAVKQHSAQEYYPVVYTVLNVTSLYIRSEVDVLLYWNLW